MVLSELIRGTADSLPKRVRRRIGAAFVTVGFGLAIMGSAGCGSGNNYGPQVSPETMSSGAQKSLDQLKANTTMDPRVKAAEIKHLEGEIAQAQGQTTKTKPGPPGPPKP